MLEPALKQRLVGVSVLIALAVIFIPMLFSGNNIDKNQSISIEIPKEPSNLKRKVLELDTASPDDIVIKQGDTVVEQVKEIDSKITRSEMIIDLVDNTNKPQKTNIIKDAKPVETVKDIVKQSATKSKKETPIMPTEVKIPSITANNKATYRVKLGSFSQQKNAQQLKAKIINKGIKAYVEKNSATGLYKVTSKQFDTKKLAENLNKKIGKLRLNIGKTTVEELTAEQGDMAQAQIDTGWVIQIGSFSSKENSLKLRDKIRKKSFVTFVDEVLNSKFEKRYRVRVGPYATREKSKTQQKILKSSMGLDGLIKPHEKQRIINK